MMNSYSYDPTMDSYIQDRKQKSLFKLTSVLLRHHQALQLKVAQTTDAFQGGQAYQAKFTRSADVVLTFFRQTELSE